MRMVTPSLGELTRMVTPSLGELLCQNTEPASLKQSPPKKRPRSTLPGLRFSVNPFPEDLRRKPP
jgi:hypothetical protein